MKYEFEVYQMEVEDHLFWVAKSKRLKGCVGQGETTAEAISELEGNEIEWLETAKQCGIPIPDIFVRTDAPQYSGKISLRFSPFVHEQAFRPVHCPGSNSVGQSEWHRRLQVPWNGL